MCVCVCVCVWEREREREREVFKGEILNEIWKEPDGWRNVEIVYSDNSNHFSVYLSLTIFFISLSLSVLLKHANNLQHIKSQNYCWIFGWFSYVTAYLQVYNPMLQLICKCTKQSYNLGKMYKSECCLSSLHWLILGFFYAHFVQWSIFQWRLQFTGGIPILSHCKNRIYSSNE